MKVDLALIAAVAKNGVIGNNGELPWRLSADLQRFKQLTMGNPVIMGRKTWQSLRKPLPGRFNIVVTSDVNFYADAAMIAHSLEQALEQACRFATEAVTKTHEKQIFIIGGGSLFGQSLPFANHIYLTEVQDFFAGDAFFPYFSLSDWNIMLSQEVASGEKDSHATLYRIYERKLKL